MQDVTPNDSKSVELVPITFRLPADIKSKLDELAMKDRRNLTRQVEWLIDREYDRVFGEKPEPLPTAS